LKTLVSINLQIRHSPAGLDLPPQIYEILTYNPFLLHE